MSLRPSLLRSPPKLSHLSWGQPAAEKPSEGERHPSINPGGLSRSQPALASELIKGLTPWKQSYIIGRPYMYLETQSPGIPTSQEDEKESFSLKACYISKKAG